MTRRTSWVKVRFTVDTFPSACGCGTASHLLRRGRVALLPKTHRALDGSVCPRLEWQQTVMRTEKAFGCIGLPSTEAELSRKLRTP